MKENPTFLKEHVIKSFSESELRELCFDLRVDWKEIKNDSFKITVINLLEFVGRRGKLADLVSRLKVLRPHINWENNHDLTKPLNLEAEQIKAFKKKSLFDILVEDVKRDRQGNLELALALEKIKQYQSKLISLDRCRDYIISAFKEGRINFRTAKLLLSHIGIDEDLYFLDNLEGDK